MLITDLITVERIICGATAVNKQRSLDLLGELLATGLPWLSADEIVTRLVKRESLALSRGVTVPHSRVKGCTRGAFELLSHWQQQYAFA